MPHCFVSTLSSSFFPSGVEECGMLGSSCARFFKESSISCKLSCSFFIVSDNCLSSMSCSGVGFPFGVKVLRCCLSWSTCCKWLRHFESRSIKFSKPSNGNDRFIRPSFTNVPFSLIFCGSIIFFTFRI